MEDVTDAVLSRLAEKEWVEIEEEWDRGLISSRDCMARQVKLIQGGWKAVKSVLDGIRLDPTFAPFATWCTASGIPLVVVSDGLDSVIRHLLWRDEIPVDGIWANHLNETGDRLFLTFGESPVGRACEAGLCKCQVMQLTSPSHAHRVVIGFAKSKLLEFCVSRNIQCHSFVDFDSIRHVLEMMTGRGAFLQAHIQTGLVGHAV